MRSTDATRLDHLMYRRIGPHLIHAFDGNHAVMRSTDHAAAHKLHLLRSTDHTKHLLKLQKGRLS